MKVARVYKGNKGILFFRNRPDFCNTLVFVELLHDHYNMEIDIDEIILIQGKWVTQNTHKWHSREPKSKQFSQGAYPWIPTPNPPFTIHAFGAPVTFFLNARVTPWLTYNMNSK